MQDSDVHSFAIRTLHVSATLADCDNMEIDDITLFVLLCCSLAGLLHTRWIHHQISDIDKNVLTPQKLWSYKKC